MKRKWSEETFTELEHPEVTEEGEEQKFPTRAKYRKTQAREGPSLKRGLYTAFAEMKLGETEPSKRPRQTAPSVAGRRRPREEYEFEAEARAPARKKRRLSLEAATEYQACLDTLRQEHPVGYRQIAIPVAAHRESRQPIYPTWVDQFDLRNYLQRRTDIKPRTGALEMCHQLLDYFEAQEQEMGGERFQQPVQTLF